MHYNGVCCSCRSSVRADAAGSRNQCRSHQRYLGSRKIRRGESSSCWQQALCQIQSEGLVDYLLLSFNHLKWTESRCVPGAKDWLIAEPEQGNFTVQLDDLYPGTRYEVVGVSVVTDQDGTELEKAESPPYYYTTAGESKTCSVRSPVIAECYNFATCIIP